MATKKKGGWYGDSAGHRKAALKRKTAKGGVKRWQKKEGGWRQVPSSLSPLTSKQYSMEKWVNNNTGEVVQVTQIQMHTLTPWWVSGTWLSVKEFRTKKEALNFAKRYMRENA